jgi:secondary thiamine-phosphate synthase enzyme
MRHSLHHISLETQGAIEFVDVTERVRSACAESGIRDGLATVYTTHTTAGVKINERCDRLQRDMRDFLEQVVPAGDYRHDEDTVDGRPNGQGHLMALLMGASETIPVCGGKLMLGKWQSIFFLELDGPRKERQVTVRIVGE